MNRATLITLRLWKEGLGTPAQIRAMPVTDVLDAWEYVRFKDDYEATAHELNRPK